jgi:hypothetical protein
MKLGKYARCESIFSQTNISRRSVLKSMRRKLQLWEWLALVFVGLVAAMVFMPVYACACGSPSTACISTVKQLTTSQLIYAADFDEKMPPSPTWIDSTTKYVRNEEAFHHPKPMNSDDFARLRYGYAFNKSMGGVDSDLVTEPAKDIILFDSVNDVRNANDLLLSLPKPGRHHNRNTFGFMDGHVKGRASP